MVEQFTRPQMINAIVSHLDAEGYKVLTPYSDDFKPARVPIYAIKKHAGQSPPNPKNASPHIFVDIICEKSIKVASYFEDTEYAVADDDGKIKIKGASSGEFFRHYFKKAKVFWAVPDYSLSDESFQYFRRKCDNSGIGIFIVKKVDDCFSVEVVGDQPTPLIKERFDLLNSTIEKIFNKSMNKQDKESLFEVFEKFSTDDLKYLVFYPDPIYNAKDLALRSQEFSISGELINRVSELSNVRYKGILKKFADNYYRENKDPYEVALDVTKELWNKYGLKYPDLHRDFEPILKLNPRYRDHFLHAFQVFLCGIYILDSLYENLPNNNFTQKLGNRIEDAWLIASTYHDYAYVVEKFNKWTSDFFRGALHFTCDETEHAPLLLAEPYIKEGFMFFTKDIIKSLGLNIDNALLDFIYKRILEDKNHSLLSALSLAKYISLKKNQNHKFDNRALLAAYKAIAIHDPGIWKFLAGKADEKFITDEILRRMNNKIFFPELKFSDDIISFLLNLCDCIQEEGRVGAKYVENGAILEKLSFEGDKIVIEIAFNGNNHQKAFKDKVNEITGVKDFIKADGLFQIVIRDINDGTEHSQTI